MGLSWSKTWSSKWLLSHISSCCHLTSLPGRQLSWGSQEWLWVDILLGEGTSLASADSPFWIPGGNFTCLDFFLSSGGRKWNHGFFFFFKIQSSSLCYSWSSFNVYPMDSDGKMGSRPCLSSVLVLILRSTMTSHKPFTPGLASFIFKRKRLRILCNNSSSDRHQVKNNHSHDSTIIEHLLYAKYFT